MTKTKDNRRILSILHRMKEKAFVSLPKTLTITAGAAFGSGAHPSTFLMLELLQGVATARSDIASVLDIGTGSGILSIAAARHFPGARIIASDTEAASPAFVAHNAALNGVEGRIAAFRALDTDHPQIRAGGPYDLLLCNISFEAILPMLRDFHALTHPGSLLLFSGLQLPMRDTMSEALGHSGLSTITILAHTPWYAMLVRHAAHPFPASPAAS